MTKEEAVGGEAVSGVGSQESLAAETPMDLRPARAPQTEESFDVPPPSGKRASVAVVIPVYDEADSLAELHAQIVAAVRPLPCRLEIVFVDDGSTDGSWQRLLELRDRDERVKLLRLRRNFGKAAALEAGFAHVGAEIVFTMDADLQDDPAEIPNFLSKLRGGDEKHRRYDLVSGWKRQRHDPWHKTLPSRVFNGVVSRLTGVKLHDHNCGFKCYRRQVLREITLYGDFHRFTAVLAAARGFRVGEMVVRHRARRFGRSKYGWRRFFRGGLDLLTVKFLTSYGARPQHLLGNLGLISGAVGVAGLAYLAAVWALTRFGWGFGPIGTRPLLAFSALLLILGVQLLATGLLAELITAGQQRTIQPYSLAESHGFEESP